MPCQVLGKRSHSSSFSSSSPSRSPTPAPKSRRTTRASAALEPPSPDSTPNPKRVKTCLSEVEYDDGSNKENIPPEPVQAASPNASRDAPTSTDMTTPRALRASRRASTESARSTTTPRRRVSSTSKPHSTASSSRISTSPPILRKHAQLRTDTKTPSKTMARLSLSTPPPTPVSSTTEDAPMKPTSPLTLARALLRPQAHESAPLVGREQERNQILDFLAPFLASKSRADDVTSLYVSGAPGTGKTALVNEVLKSVSMSATSNDIDVDDVTVRVVYVNCMALGTKDGMTGVWERCVEEFGPAREKKRGAAPKMDWTERFSKLVQGLKCILVLDEIDYLATSASASMSHIFALASDPQTRACLRIIGISNTHTLTDTKPSAHADTIHFGPYTAGQMKTVLGTRLAALPPSAVTLFPTPTLSLLALKIAGQTGDIRTMFSVARRALDIAATGAASSSAVTVTPSHILAALKASNASTGASQAKSGGAEVVTRVRNLGLHARFALAALLLATKRVTAGLNLTGTASSASSGKLKENAQTPSTSSGPGRDAAAPAIDVTALHAFYSAILNRGAESAFRRVGRTEFGDLVGLLEGSGLVELAQGRGFGNKGKGVTKSKGTQVACIASGVREEELVRGLVGSAVSVSTDGADVNVREEEVKHVWEREVGRIGREIRARFGNGGSKKSDFDGAEED